jgi:hypothetical protein
MKDQRLPNCARIATALQACVTCLVLIAWGAWATWGVFPNSLIASSILFGPAFLLCVVATLGLWKGKMFGWVLSLLGSAVTSLVFCFAARPFCIVSAGFFVFLLSPKVQDFYVRNY